MRILPLHPHGKSRKRPISRIQQREMHKDEEILQRFGRQAEIEDAKRKELTCQLADLDKALKAIRSEVKEAQSKLLEQLQTTRDHEERFTNAGLAELARVLIFLREQKPGLHNSQDDEPQQHEWQRLTKELRKAKQCNLSHHKRLSELQKIFHEQRRSELERKGVQRRINKLLHKQLREKDLLAFAQQQKQELGEKVDILADHIERLMLHLKHESVHKAKAEAIEGRTIREMELCRIRNDTFLAKNRRREKVVGELQQGERVLADQLFLLDQKHCDMRERLFQARVDSQREIHKIAHDVRKRRMEWEMESEGLIPIEMVKVPEHVELYRSAPAVSMAVAAMREGRRSAYTAPM